MGYRGVTMILYRDLTAPQRRALHLFSREGYGGGPVPTWARVGLETVKALVKAGLLEPAGRQGSEPIFRITDDGSRVHEDMWRDGKVPHIRVAVRAAPDEA
jgi:hypothetical protein